MARTARRLWGCHPVDVTAVLVILVLFAWCMYTPSRSSGDDVSIDVVVSDWEEDGLVVVGEEEEEGQGKQEEEQEEQEEKQEGPEGLGEQEEQEKQGEQEEEEQKQEQQEQQQQEEQKQKQQQQQQQEEEEQKQEQQEQQQEEEQKQEQQEQQQEEEQKQEQQEQQQEEEEQKQEQQEQQEQQEEEEQKQEQQEQQQDDNDKKPPKPTASTDNWDVSVNQACKMCERERVWILPKKDGIHAHREDFQIILRTGTVERHLSVFPVDKGFAAEFVPDASYSGSYEFTVVLPDGKTLDLSTGKIGNGQCFQWGSLRCHSILNHDVPQPCDFILVDDSGHEFFRDDESLHAKAGEKKTFYIRPSPEALQYYGQAAKEAFFNVRAVSAKHITSFDVESEFDTTQNGYKFELDIRDEGSYRLIVTAQWFYGRRDLKDPVPPFLVSSHMDFQYLDCNARKSRIHGSPFKLTVAPSDTPLPVADHKCLTGTAPGRWVSLKVEARKEVERCAPPLCTGGRDEAWMILDWNGSHQPWVYAPFDCWYHFYSPKDIEFCAKQKKIQWIHVMGDSQIREVAGLLMSFFPPGDTNKFHFADLVLANTTLRLSFYAFEEAVNMNEGGTRDFDKTVEFMEQFNVVGKNTSTPRPDIFVFNPALSYAAWKETVADYESWLKKMTEYVGDSFQNGPQRGFWVSTGYLHSQAHAETNPLTCERQLLFDEMGRTQFVPATGFEVVDAMTPTRSRPEGAWDGLHYLRTGGAYWNGHVAVQWVQILFNTIFGDCEGESVPGTPS